MTFSQLINEAERAGYMLGSHSAREGESVRGMPTKSTIADIGFYKKDPEEDIKLPNSPVPVGVKSTYITIANAFTKLKQNKELKQEFTNAVEPYITVYNTINTGIRRTNELLQRIASLERTLKTAAKPDRIRNMIGTAKEELEEVRAIMERGVKENDAKEGTLLTALIETLMKGVEEKGKLKDAIDRYSSVVQMRKEQLKDTGNMQYLITSPIISLVKFFNNVESAATKTDVTKFKSSRGIMKTLENVPNSENLISLYDLIKEVAPKIADDSGYKGSEDIQKDKQQAIALIKGLKLNLPQNVYSSLLVSNNSFFNGEVGSEGKLLGLILNDAAKALLAKR